MTPDYSDVEFALDRVIPMETLMGETVSVHIHTVEISDDVVVTGEVDLPTWQRAYASGCFHLDEEEAPTGFEDGIRIQLTLRLRRPVTARYSSPEALLEEMVDETGSPLRHTEAWLATEVMQQVPLPDMPDASAQVGIRTSWAEPFF